MIATAGGVLSITNVAPEVGVDVTALPARSTATDMDTVAVPSPAAAV